VKSGLQPLDRRRDGGAFLNRETNMRTRRAWLASTFVIFGLFSAHHAFAFDPPAGDSHNKSASSARFAVVGYIPNYHVDRLEQFDLDRLTDLIFFSIEPTAEGSVDRQTLTPETLSHLQALKAKHGFRLLVSVGGWGRSNHFAEMARNLTNRRRFVVELTRFCVNNQFDGVDYDWEHPRNPGEESAYASLISETKKSFQSRRMIVTAAIAAWQRMPKEGLKALDRIHLMAYDHEQRHSTVESAIADIDMLISKGVPATKICLGAPLYGRMIKDANEVRTYGEIVGRSQPSPNVDEVDGCYFNGIETMKRKAAIVRERGLAGMMIWEIGQDAPGDSSLLKAISTELNAP
jgi:GH18 family chitinase